MTPGIESGVSGDRKLEKQIERQMGCMTGFLQLFDRQQTLAGKRLCSAKQLPCSPAAESLSTSERSDASSTSFGKATVPTAESCPSLPEKIHLFKQSIPVTLPIFEVKDGLKTSWKLREVPRLSLDSRAVVDIRGKLRPREIRTTPLFSGISSDCMEARDDQDKQRRSPSVVARLMGLEALPDASIEQQPKKFELRRSASESRVSRDLSQFNFQKQVPNCTEELLRPRKLECYEFKHRDKPEPQRGPAVSLQRKSAFDSLEFFPEPKQTVSIYGEIEKRLRMYGIDEPAKDLETLRQILEALHLKGLLHEKPSNHLNAVYKHQSHISSFTDSQFTVVEPPLKPFQRSQEVEQTPLKHRSTSPRSPAAPEINPSARNRRDPGRRILMRSPEPCESSRNAISSQARRRPFNVDGRRVSQPVQHIAVVHSPRTCPRRPGSDQSTSRSPRISRSKSEVSQKDSFAEDDVSIFCDASILSSPSQFDFEKQRSIEEYRTGRSLLKRCDKLLHSIAAITSTAEQVTATDQQPSPVSVLDSSFLSDESPAPSLTKRIINFNDETADWEDHRTHKATPSARFLHENGPAEANGAVPDDDYAYIADIILDIDTRCGPANLFTTLERRHHAAGSCKTAALHRRLIFDTVFEIIDRKRSLPPWSSALTSPSSAFPCSENSTLAKVWEEVRWLREEVAGTSMNALAGKMISQGMAGEEWAFPMGLPGAILCIEQQLFKDLVGDTIRELSELSMLRRGASPPLPCRKLIF